MNQQLRCYWLSWYLSSYLLPFLKKRNFLQKFLLRIWMTFRFTKTIGRPNDWLSLVYLKVPVWNNPNIRYMLIIYYLCKVLWKLSFVDTPSLTWMLFFLLEITKLTLGRTGKVTAPKWYKGMGVLWHHPSLLGACDIIQDGRHLGPHLGFYRKLEIAKKHFAAFGWYFLPFSPNKGKKHIFLQKWLDHLLLMTSYLVTIVTDSHQTCVKMCLRDMCTATENGRSRK